MFIEFNRTYGVDWTVEAKYRCDTVKRLDVSISS